MVRQVLCHAYGQPNLLTTHIKASDYSGAFFVLPASDSGGGSGRSNRSNWSARSSRSGQWQEEWSVAGGKRQIILQKTSKPRIVPGLFLCYRLRIRVAGGVGGRRGKKEKGSDKPVKMCFYADFLAYFHYFLYLYTQKYTVAAAAHALVCNKLPATHH